VKYINPVEIEIIKANMLRYIAQERDAVILQQYQNDHHKDINGLPAPFDAEVREALRSKMAELEPL